MNEPLQIEKISFSLSRKKILDQIQFTIPSGKALALVGHNGAGKTTLFHLILGLKFAQQGSIQLFGQSSLRHSARARVGYIPERPYLNLEDTLSQSLKFAGGCLGLATDILQTRIHETVKRVGLEKNIQQKLKSFSKGMLQRTLIAQSLLGNPDLLIMDEPMSGLDPEGRQFIRELMLEWKKTGKTLLFSTHTLEDVDLIADDVLILDGGKQKFFGSVSEWRTRS